MSNGLITSNTQKGIIIRTLGNLITVWPLNVNQKEALIFQDIAPISSQYLKVGDWIQMEVEHGDVVVYREKIEPVLQTLVTLRGNVQVKTRMYFPNGIDRNCEHVIGYSDDLGPVGVFFQCPELSDDFLYDVWVARPHKKFASLEKQYNVHWCLVKQTMIPLMRNSNRTKLLWENWSVNYDSEHNNTLTESNVSSREVDFSYALNFNDNALRRLYSDPAVREAVYQCSSDFARSIEAYLRISRN
uniref:RNA_ligase domain-containing protein n=1 Tax=Elaeophora elaphi TaxID=1147741 RepID=A0A0R3RGH5_9BILA